MLALIVHISVVSFRGSSRNILPNLFLFIAGDPDLDISDGLSCFLPVIHCVLRFLNFCHKGLGLLQCVEIFLWFITCVRGCVCCQNGCSCELCWI